MVPIFLGTVLEIENMQEPQSDLKVKESPSILKDDLFPRIHPFIFTPIPPELLELLECFIGYVQVQKLTLVVRVHYIHRE